MGKAYTDDERIAALALLEANSGNIRKTARETGITRQTLERWHNGILADDARIEPLKREIQEDRKALMKRALTAGLERALELVPLEKDLFKLTGFIKTMSDLRITEEVADDLLSKPPEGVTQIPAPISSTNHQSSLEQGARA